MARILITEGIDASAAQKIKDLGHEIVETFYTPDELKEQIKNFDAVITRSATKITGEIIDGALVTKRLRLIIRSGVGLDNIDVAYAAKNKIMVANTPHGGSRAVAELVIGQMFALARYIYMTNISMRKGLWNKKNYEGIELSGKTLGLVGFGRIAQETARLAKALGMTVIYHTRSGEKEGFPNFKFVTMETLLKNSDFISLHIPIDKEKGPTIAAKEFEMMKDGVYLINCARGGVVREEALLAALDSGKVAAAALDVFEEEPTKNERLYTHNRVSLTPHIGASTGEARERIGREIVTLIKEQLGEVNFKA